MSGRAFSADAKAERSQEILDAAAELFERIGFREVSMSLLAERAGVAKGTLYLYFPTKEAVYLALYRSEMAKWFSAVNSGLPTLPDRTTQKLAGLLVDNVAARPRLPALAALLHTVLERNIPFDDALAFKQELAGRLAPLAAALETTFDFLGEGDGQRLLLRFHALVIGCWQSATPAPVVRRVLEREELAGFRMDFSEELENTLVLLLEGWRHAGGGF